MRSDSSKSPPGPKRSRFAGPDRLGLCFRLGSHDRAGVRRLRGIDADPGAFYSRIEGDLEATREGVKATVRAVRRRAREQNLSSEIADEALDRALWGRSRAAPANLAAEMRAKQAISEVQAEHEKIVSAVAGWLAREGYSVSRPAHGFDLVGSRADAVAGVEVKASLAIGMVAVRQAASFQLPTSPPRARDRRILIFPGNARVSSDARAEAAHANIELMTVDGQGNVTALAEE